MGRIFSILAAVTLAMVFVAGIGTYWVSVYEIDQAKRRSVDALANGIALGVSSQINIMQQIVVDMAATSDVVAAVESASPEQMLQLSSKLEQFLPSVEKIRILAADIKDLDESDTPFMGNADFLMVKETLKKNQLSVIQGLGKNRHLAITAPIKKDNVPIGVVLASLKFDFLQTIVNKSYIEKGLFELKQDSMTLAQAGDLQDKTDSGDTMDISNTSWKIHYWPESSVNLMSLSLIVGMISIPMLIAFLAFFIYYRNITRIFREDLSSILNVVKDLMTGKNIGSYFVRLNEMKALTSSIRQFKRVLETDEELSVEGVGGSKEHEFFDVSMDVTLMDPALVVIDENTSTPKKQSTTEFLPISTPNNLETTTQSIKVPVPATVNSSLFRVCDIRGIAGKTLTEEIIFDIGRAIGSEAKEKSINTIILGRDTRPSSIGLSESLAKGIVTTGVNVLDLGLVPTPLVYFVIEHTEGKSGVMVTGTNNSVEYNGLKIVLNNEILANNKILQLKQRIENEDFSSETPGSIEQNNMFINEYIGMISDDIHIVRPMVVVIDCANGAAASLAPTLLKTLGCEVIELFCDIDESFPNHCPDPGIPENLVDLMNAVKEYKADVGIAIDGDGGRLNIVDCKGKIIWPDRQMMLFAKEVLTSKPGSEIIYDVKSSRLLGEQIVKSGGRPLMWKTGQPFIKAKLKEVSSALAGEMSGHIFFNDRWFGFDDALYTACRLIEMLSADTRNSDEVFSDFPDSLLTPEITIELAEGENIEFMEKLIASANFKDGKMITIDGLRVDFEEGWGVVRASTTRPMLVLRFGADNDASLNRLQTQFKEELIKVQADLAVPF